MSEVTVRPSRPGDAAGILDARESAWLETYPNEQFGITRDAIKRYFLSRGSHDERAERQRTRTKELDDKMCEWVAEADGRVVGWCVAKVESEDIGRLQAIYVSPEAQGRGVGGKLIKQAFTWLGDRDVLVNVASYNNGAIGFYEKYGFVKTGSPVNSFTERPNPNRPNIPEVEMKRQVNRV